MAYCENGQDQEQGGESKMLWERQDEKAQRKAEFALFVHYVIKESFNPAVCCC
jgi:hypothetical protein